MKTLLFILFALYSIPWSHSENNISSITKVKRSELSQQEVQLIRGFGPMLSSSIIHTKAPLSRIKGVGKKRLALLRLYCIDKNDI